MSKIQVNNSIRDVWVASYLEFLNNPTLLEIRKEKPYPLMNEERQALLEPIRELSFHLLELVENYPDIRNFLDMTTTRFHDMMRWLEKYNELIPKVDPNPQDVEVIEQHSTFIYGIEDFKNYALIPEDDLNVLIMGFNAINKIIAGLGPFYKAFPHASSQISTFIFDLPREYSGMMSHIHDNFKSGRYKIAEH